MSEMTQLEEFKVLVWRTVEKYQREYDWCNEPLYWLEEHLGLSAPPPVVPEDPFPSGTFLSYEGTTYQATKGFNGRWEYGGMGSKVESTKYEDVHKWLKDMGSKPRVLRYGSIHNTNAGKWFNYETNELLESP